MRTELRAVHIGQRLEKFHAFYLVFHFLHSEVAERDVLKLEAAVLASAIVEDKHEVSFLCHINLPAARKVIARRRDITRVRPAINIHNGRIFFICVKVHGLDHAVVQVGCAVGGFNGAACYLGHVVFLPRVFGRKYVLPLAAARIYDINAPRNGRRRIAVEHITSRRRKPGGVNTGAVVEKRAAKRLEV